MRPLAHAQGLSAATLRRLWKPHNLQPQRVQTFPLCRKPKWVEKLSDLVGLYLDPPDPALVLGVNEKSPIQALDRTQPGRPRRKGRCGTLTHDSKRPGTPPWCAALRRLEGVVLGDGLPQPQHQEFIRFLKRIDPETPPALRRPWRVDHYGTHQHPRVKAWRQRHPRVHLHFTPTSSSGLNLVERGFRELTPQRLRRGSFHHGKALMTGSQDDIQNPHQKPHVFVWSAAVERPMRKIPKCKEAFDAVH